jgi:hypothetical protein
MLRLSAVVVGAAPSPRCGAIADRSEFRGARFEEDKTDQRVLHATHRKLACDGYRLLSGGAIALPAALPLNAGNLRRDRYRRTAAGAAGPHEIAPSAVDHD